MKPTTLTLQTGRLLLQPFSHADAHEIFAETTPPLTRCMTFDPPDCLQSFETTGQRWSRLIDEGSEYTFVIRRRQNGDFIGTATNHRVTEHEPELGIWVGGREQGRGYGHEAAAAVLNWRPERFSPAAYRHPAAKENLPSRRIGKRLGGQVIATENSAKLTSLLYRIPHHCRRPTEPHLPGDNRCSHERPANEKAALRPPLWVICP